MSAIAVQLRPGRSPYKREVAGHGGGIPGDPRLHGVNETQADRHHSPSARDRLEAMMVNSYYSIYQAERGKTAALQRSENAEPEAMAPTQWPAATIGGQDATELSLDLPCTRDPELFFAESPQDVEQAKAMCRSCRARIACLAGALEREEPWGVWGGELLLRGAIVPRKRPRGRPRKDTVTTVACG